MRICIPCHERQKLGTIDRLCEVVGAARLAAFFFVTLGAVAVGSAFEGYLFTNNRRWENILLALSGICVFIPNVITRGLGVGFIVLFLLSQIMRVKKSKT